MIAPMRGPAISKGLGIVGANVNPMTNYAFGGPPTLEVVSHNNAGGHHSGASLQYQDKSTDFAAKIKMKS